MIFGITDRYAIKAVWIKRNYCTFLTTVISRRTVEVLCWCPSRYLILTLEVRFSLLSLLCSVCAALHFNHDYLFSPMLEADLCDFCSDVPDCCDHCQEEEGEGLEAGRAGGQHWRLLDWAYNTAVLFSS